jgi:hypothetical protein
MSDLPITDPFVHGLWKGVHVQMLAYRTSSFLNLLKTLMLLKLQVNEREFEIASKKVKSGEKVKKVDPVEKALNELDEMAAVLLKNAENFQRVKLVTV